MKVLKIIQIIFLSFILYLTCKAAPWVSMNYHSDMECTGTPTTEFFIKADGQCCSLMGGSVSTTGSVIHTYNTDDCSGTPDSIEFDTETCDQGTSVKLIGRLPDVKNGQMGIFADTSVCSPEEKLCVVMEYIEIDNCIEIPCYEPSSGISIKMICNGNFLSESNNNGDDDGNVGIILGIVIPSSVVVVIIITIIVVVIVICVIVSVKKNSQTDSKEFAKTPVQSNITSSLNQIIKPSFSTQFQPTNMNQILLQPMNMNQAKVIDQPNQPNPLFINQSMITTPIYVDPSNVVIYQPSNDEQQTETNQFIGESNVVTQYM